MASLGKLDTFQHEALDQSNSKKRIRLLNLLPANPDGVIRCAIENNVSFGDGASDLSFHAVSYEWGPETRDMRLVLMNNKRHGVRPNLFDFLSIVLQHYPGGFNSLWIDALCIAQSNIEEKNHQVKQMKDVYHNASEVLVWLGQARDNSDGLFDGIVTHKSSKRQLAQPIKHAELRKTARDLIFFQPLKALFGRSYWNRTWIAQKVVLAKQITIMCGLKRASWEELNDFAGNADSFRKTSAFPRIRLARHWYHDRTKQHVSLGALLGQFSLSECSDNRDRVFALLSIANDSHLIQVDYNRSILDVLAQVLCLPQKHPPQYEASDPLASLGVHGFLKMLEDLRIKLEDLIDFRDAFQSQQAPSKTCPDSDVLSIVCSSNNIPSGAAERRQLSEEHTSMSISPTPRTGCKLLAQGPTPAVFSLMSDPESDLKALPETRAEFCHYCKFCPSGSQRWKTGGEPDRLDPSLSLKDLLDHRWRFWLTEPFFNFDFRLLFAQRVPLSYGDDPKSWPFAPKYLSMWPPLRERGKLPTDRLKFVSIISRQDR